MTAGSGERRDGVDPDAGDGRGLEWELRNARQAYERVRREAIRFQDERDQARDKAAHLTERLRDRNANLAKAKKRRDELKLEVAALEDRLRDLEDSRAFRLQSRARGVRRRLSGSRAAALSQAAAVGAPDEQAGGNGVPSAPEWARPVTFGSWRGHDPDVLRARADAAAAAGTRLGEAVASGERLRVAAIVDDFTRHSLDPECELLNLTPASWQEELDRFQPHLLFVESAWRGHDGAWHNTVPQLVPELQGIFAWCREHGVPTVFWNKEDPVHFERFLPVAAEADVVFTSDIDRVAEYRLRLGHDRAHLLPFAAQPHVHNPVEIGVRREALAFAGAYYPAYTDRMRDLRSLVSAAAATMPVEIFDRNYGTTVPTAQFPEEYQRHIVGTLQPEEIDVAYKGYRFGLNLNSVKSSRSMFARRVYELLASNTVTVSNHSRAIKLFFGDLVPMSDSESLMRSTLAELVADPDTTDRLRALGLRKVLREHTYAHRLAAVVATVTGEPLVLTRPKVAVAVVGDDRDVVRRSAGLAAAQREVDVEVVVVTAAADVTDWAAGAGLRTVEPARLDGMTLGQLAGPEAAGVALFHGDDWYGDHYLRDLADARTYGDADVVGKDRRFRADGSEAAVEETGSSYVPVTGLRLRRGLVAAAAAARMPAADLLADRPVDTSFDQFAVHRFDYCEAGVGNPSAATCGSWLPIDQGLDLSEITAVAEGVEVDRSLEPSLVVLPAELQPVPGAGQGEAPVTINNARDWMTITSQLGEEESSWLVGSRPLEISEVWPDRVARLGFRAEGDGDVALVLRFRACSGESLGATVHGPGANHVVPVPEGAVSATIGWRVTGPGRATVSPVHLTSWPFDAPDGLMRGDTLLVTNQYPSYGDLYRNAFVHARVRRYQRAGLTVDVFRHRSGKPVLHTEFEGVDVMRGDTDRLASLLSSGSHRRILVHALDEDMWSVIRSVGPEIPVLVWVHGSEIQPLSRRMSNYPGEVPERAAATSARRVAFWQRVLDEAGPHVHFVFPSHYLAETVQEDLQRTLAEERFTVLPNPIDTDVFRHREKAPDQRHRILSIRPYTTRIYANDLAVAAVLDLVDEPWFDELAFHFVGDGPLFDETLAPLRDLPNVTIERRYLEQAEIAALHADHGVMLIPSRSDTHGVTRDEAMASGLVPIVSAVAAVPEFVSETEGFLAPPEDHRALARAIAELHADPDDFQRRSAAAAARVRRQAGIEVTLAQELALIREGR
ncbi:glycosyltransferase [Nocardioides caeni]|uniref:Glycosyltransferase n=1 Tax=Nocardioides caeni TaxID=574700 RepID=A0A4S8N961_9ACTN|nr:glycosyltransferase [Nocardioides caeni]THV12927.1 glycosyltransferase [Nocardioides caeni]